MNDFDKKVWVVSADMGYGHQRAVYPLKDIAEDGIITVGSSGAISKSEQKLWKRLLNAYELFSKYPIRQQHFFQTSVVIYIFTIYNFILHTK